MDQLKPQYFVTASGLLPNNFDNMKSDLDFVSTNGLTEFKNKVSHKNCQLAFIDCEFDEYKREAVVEITRKVAPHCAIVLNLPKEEMGKVKYYINELECKFLSFTNTSAPDLEALFKRAILNQQDLNVSKSKLLKIKTLNQDLEALTGDLEDLVQQGVSSLLESKERLESSVTQFRTIVQFVKELSAELGLQELMQLLRKEIKKFHKVFHFFLGIDKGGGNGSLIYFQGQSSQLVKKDVGQFWNSVNTIRINSLDDQKYLADQLARPTNHIVSVELKGNSTQKGQSKHVLYIEHSMSLEEVEGFINFISYRVQALSIVLDRILLESEMIEASQLWESTFDNISDPVAILFDDYEILRSNQSFQNSDVKDPCYKAFAGKNEPCEGCPLQKALKTNMPALGQVSHNGKLFEVHSYPISLDEGEPSKVVVNHYVDITLANELQGKVIQNEKMSAIGHLAGNIAHELNNPLTGIRSMSQVLIAEADKEGSLYSDLVEIESAAKRCQDIIVNLLEFSSAESKVRLGFYSLNDLVNKTLPLLKTVTSDHKREVDLGDALPEVKVEPQLMQQVIFNLVNNSCQAMKTNGSLGIKTFQDDKNIYFEVEDSGEGIAPENLEKIFDPFFTTKKSGEGTGLGLSTCRSIVESFGGSIRVSSEVGQGATFRVSLPILETDQ